MRREYYVLGVIILVLVVYGGYAGAKRLSVNADLNAPQYQPAPEEDVFGVNLAFYGSPDGHVFLCPPQEHHHGYVYTPHRYPRSVGGEVTSAIHRGFSTMRVPDVDDVQWIISPPSEVAW